MCHVSSQDGRGMFSTSPVSLVFRSRFLQHAWSIQTIRHVAIEISIRHYVEQLNAWDRILNRNIMEPTAAQRRQWLNERN